MKTINRLEASIHSLIEVNRKLKNEHNRAQEDAEYLRNELNNTKEIINGLQLNLEKMEKNKFEYNKHIAKKKEIIEHIKSILYKLDQLKTIDDITNDQS